jgi:hypothetical protein
VVNWGTPEWSVFPAEMVVQVRTQINQFAFIYNFHIHFSLSFRLVQFYYRWLTNNMRSMAGFFCNIDFLHEHLDSPQFCGRVYVPLAFCYHLFLFIFVLCLVFVGEVFSIQYNVIKFCQWLAAGRWFTLGIPVSYTNKTSLHEISDNLLKVA